MLHCEVKPLVEGGVVRVASDPQRGCMPAHLHYLQMFDSNSYVFMCNAMHVGAAGSAYVVKEQRDHMTRRTCVRIRT